MRYEQNTKLYSESVEEKMEQAALVTDDAIEMTREEINSKIDALVNMDTAKVKVFDYTGSIKDFLTKIRSKSGNIILRRYSKQIIVENKYFHNFRCMLWFKYFNEHPEVVEELALYKDFIEESNLYKVEKLFVVAYLEDKKAAANRFFGELNKVLKQQLADNSKLLNAIKQNDDTVKQRHNKEYYMNKNNKYYEGCNGQYASYAITENQIGLIHRLVKTYRISFANVETRKECSERIKYVFNQIHAGKIGIRANADYGHVEFIDNAWKFVYDGGRN